MEIYTVEYSNLETWLAEQNSNTKDTAYVVKITEIPDDFVSTISAKLLTRKDVFLDLSNTELPSVTSLYKCFQGCSSLTKAPIIPNSVTSMNSCFLNCTSLTEAPAIPNSVTNMYCCFRGCTSLTEAPIIPDSVTDMYYCFSGCTSLEKAPVIPDSVTDMRGCFRGCTSLVEASVIPDGVTDMTYCFDGCTSLTESPIIPDSVTDMTGCFYKCTSLINAPVIPNRVTNMRSCFYNCTSLTKAPVIGDSVKSLFHCFINCTSLTEAPVIPDSVTSMNQCFYNCTSLTKVPVIGKSVKDMWYCFAGCSSLESINDWRPTDLSKVDTTRVFSGCTSLKHIYVNKDIQQLEKYSLCQVNVKDSEVEYSFIDSDFTNEVTGVIEDVVHTLHIDGLIDEFIIGQSGSVTWELAKKALESKTQFSNLDKDFSPNDPHMVIWAKDKSKVKTNIIENALAGEDSTTELNDTDSLIVVQDGETKKVEFETLKKENFSRTYLSLSELSKDKNISLTLNVDNCQKIMDALKPREQFEDWFTNTTSSSRFGISSTYGDYIDKIHFVKNTETDGSITAFTNKGYVFTRGLRDGYLYDWAHT